MELFKERVRYMGRGLRRVGILVAILMAGMGFAWVAEKNQAVDVFATALTLLVIAIAVIGSLSVFVNWLIIEPFKSRKKKKEE